MPAKLLEGKTILLIEKDRSFSDTISDHLAFQSCAVLAAGDDKSINYKEHKIDAAIIDVTSVTQDINEVIKNVNILGWVPTLLLWSEGFLIDKSNGFANADAFAIKPCTAREVVAHIDNLLQVAFRAKQCQPSATVHNQIEVNGNEHLTKREIDVLRLVASGFSNEKIARSMFRSKHTVESHISNILSKTGLRNRTQLSLWFRQKFIA